MLETRLLESAAPPAQGRCVLPDRTWCDAVCRIVELTVTRAFAVGEAELNAGSRGVARAAHARQAAMYLAHVACHLSLTQVGRMFHRDRTTVAHACAVIEDARDDPVFDRALDHLEWCITLMANRSRQTSPLDP